MKTLILATIFVASIKCIAHEFVAKNDALLKKEDARLALDNGGLVLNRFVVRGDIYLTSNFFIYHPN
jgi:hypothetical protein